MNDSVQPSQNLSAEVIGPEHWMHVKNWHFWQIMNALPSES
ncbi:hypothetical protein ACLMAL_26460 [Nocardia sp. CWNU-33]